jgi:hypothetical protein
MAPLEKVLIHGTGDAAGGLQVTSFHASFEYTNTLSFKVLVNFFYRLERGEWCRFKIKKKKIHFNSNRLIINTFRYIDSGTTYRGSRFPVYSISKFRSNMCNHTLIQALLTDGPLFTITHECEFISISVISHLILFGMDHFYGQNASE